MKYLLLAFICIGVLSCKKESPARIDNIHPFHSDFIKDRNVDIWLPKNYSPNKKYQVLYMHDGQMLFDSTATWNKQSWNAGEILQQLIDDKKVPETIIVGIWNIANLRSSNYWPQKPFEQLSLSMQNSLTEQRLNNVTPNSDHYLKFIVEELKPYIDKKYATYTDKEHTFIAGSSMGGLISMYAICEYPNVFAGAACLSTHWIGSYEPNEIIPDSFIHYLDQHITPATKHKFYFDHGTETLDQFYGPYQTKVDHLFHHHGFDKTNYMSKVFNGAKHAETDWQRRLDIPFTFILNK